MIVDPEIVRLALVTYIDVLERRRDHASMGMEPELAKWEVLLERARFSLSLINDKEEEED